MSGASEAAAERAIVVLKRAIEAAENSNQAGENFVVAAAAAPDLVEALEKIANARTAMDGGSIAECRRIAEKALAKAREGGAS